MNAGIESGPVALWVLRFINSSWTFPVNSDLRHAWRCAGAFVWYIGEIFLCKDRLKLHIEDICSRFGVTLEEAFLVLQWCHTCEFLPFAHYMLSWAIKGALQ